MNVSTFASFCNHDLDDPAEEVLSLHNHSHFLVYTVLVHDVLVPVLALLCGLRKQEGRASFLRAERNIPSLLDCLQLCVTYMVPKCCRGTFSCISTGVCNLTSAHHVSPTSLNGEY